MRAGIWLIGARGSVATTTIVGTLAVRAGLAEPTGCVTAHPALSGVPLPGFGDLVLGGHDAITSPVVKKAEQLATAGVIPARLVGPLGTDLAEVEAELRPVPTGATQAQAAGAITSDIKAFGDRHQLDRVVVINVASTEAAPAAHPAHARLEDLAIALTEPGPVLPASALYAYAAFRAGCPYVDFTPSTGARVPALAELARERHCVAYPAD